MRVSEQFASSVPAGKVRNGGYVRSHAIPHVAYRRPLETNKPTKQH